MPDTRQVIEHHLQALLAGDVTGVMAQFADDAFLITPEGTLRGRAELTEGFERLVAGLFAPGTYRFTLDSLATEGEIALMTWHAECRGTDLPMAADTFVVRDGRIVAQTFAAVFEER